MTIGISPKQDTCTAQQRIQWTTTFDQATQKTYHLQVATQRSFNTDTIVVSFQPQRATQDTRSLSILKENQPNRLRFNTTYYTRIKIQDTNNQWSDWSTTHTFTTPEQSGPRVTIHTPDPIPTDRAFTASINTEKIESTRRSSLTYRWEVFQKERNETRTLITQNVIDIPEGSTIDHETIKESITLSLQQSQDYIIHLTTTDSYLANHPDQNTQKLATCT